MADDIIKIINSIVPPPTAGIIVTLIITMGVGVISFIVFVFLKILKDRRKSK